VRDDGKFPACKGAEDHTLEKAKKNCLKRRGQRNFKNGEESEGNMQNEWLKARRLKSAVLSILGLRDRAKSIAPASNGRAYSVGEEKSGESSISEYQEEEKRVANNVKL